MWEVNDTSVFESIDGMLSRFPGGGQETLGHNKMLNTGDEDDDSASTAQSSRNDQTKKSLISVSMGSARTM